MPDNGSIGYQLRIAVTLEHSQAQALRRFLQARDIPAEQLGPGELINATLLWVLVTQAAQDRLDA